MVKGPKKVGHIRKCGYERVSRYVDQYVKGKIYANNF